MYDTPPLLLPLSPLFQSYMNPLTELAWAPSPILDSDRVEHLFGPITQVWMGCCAWCSVKLKDIIGLKVHPQYVFK